MPTTTGSYTRGNIASDFRTSIRKMTGAVRLSWKNTAIYHEAEEATVIQRQDATTGFKRLYKAQRNLLDLLRGLEWGCPV